MSDTNVAEMPTSAEEAEVAEQLPPNRVVSRNNVNFEFTWDKFGKKSPNAGKLFPAPKFTPENLATGIQFIGAEDVCSTLTRSLRVIFMGIYEDCFDKEVGEVNWDKWQADAADFTAGVDKLKDIMEDIDELQAIQQDLVLNPDNEFGEVNAHGVPTHKAAETAKKVAEVNAKIKPLRIKKAEITAKYADRVKAREEKKAKEAAEAAKKAAAAKEAQTEVAA